MQIFRKVLFLLTNHQRRSAFILLLMLTTVALIEMIGVASILPFVTVLTNPSLIETNFILNKMFQVSSSFGVENNLDFLIALGILVFSFLIVSIIFKASTLYFQIQFVETLQHDISKRLVERYLSQPYSWFLGRHSADFAKTILSEVDNILGNVITPLIELIAKSMITIAIFTLLILVDVKTSLIVSFLLGGSYGLIYKLSSSYVGKLGKDRLNKNKLLFTSISDAFGALKEIKLSNLEQVYVKRFSDPAKTIAKNQASSTIVRELPRYALEAVAFGGIILLILYLMFQKGSFNNALPIVSLYAFAGYRLMPALQQIYASFSKFVFIGPSLNKIYDDFKNLKKFDPNYSQETLEFNKVINLKNIHYNYPNTPRIALKDLSLSISANTTVGFVGATGSGKTTTVDIILGLLEAQKGNLYVDGKIITKQNINSWQRYIGYVPQHIFLSDDTIAANIAFGVDLENINQESVENASKIANLHEFVTEELPKKYQTTIGERGVRLSGGQRQRIGIARALYHEPKLLILDEATSALDNQTEKAVMEAVNNLSKSITIILIAHRLNTVKKCDKIFLLEKGQLKNQGKFEELINNDENFRITANN
jgi:ABC-type multidrug transport system fused ATPase/permease subunit